MWVLVAQRRWQRENQILESLRQRERERLEVEAKVEMSDGVRKERMQSWTSSGKSDKDRGSGKLVSVRLVMSMLMGLVWFGWFVG